jgi:putative hydroxymethylpyrimidine transport system substrate-binding protein
MKKYSLQHFLLTSQIILLVILLSFSTLAASAPMHTLSVLLDWRLNPDHAPLIIAEQQGFFKQEGLLVKLINPVNPSNTSTLVAKDKVDIGIAYEPQFMEQVDKGLPLIRVGTLIDKPLNCLVISEDDGVKTLADLKGKPIAATNDRLTRVLLKTMLAKQGLLHNDIELVNIRHRLTEALLSHHVEAVTGMMRNIDVPALELNGHKVTTYFPEEYGVPNYSALIFITNIKHTHDPRFPLFLNALKKAVAYLDEHPKTTWQQFAKKYPQANNKVTQAAWFDTMPYFAEDPASIDHVEWKHFAEFMQQHHLIRTVQPISRYTIG